GGHRRLRGAGALPLAGPGELLVEPLLAAEQQAAGHAHVLEHDLGGVRRPDAVLLVLLALAEALGARRDDEAGLAAALELGVDAELRSEPASGSVTQKAPRWILSAVPKHWGTHSMTWSGGPVRAMAAAARPEPKMARPMPASPQNSSSRATGRVRPVGSPSDAWAKKSNE